MKRLLLISYYFPPLGLGGTQRVAKFVKYLPLYGWQPTVVTVKTIAYWASDLSLMRDVAAAEIVRTESLDPQRLLARWRRNKGHVAGLRRDNSAAAFVYQNILSRIFTPDNKILWRPCALSAIAGLMRRSQFDAVMTTSPPHSVHLIGLKVAQKYKLPWLADFRDGWAGSHVVYEPNRRYYHRNLILQNKVVSSANAVVTCSPGIESSLCSRESQRSKFHLITNGFDEEDFPQMMEKRERRDDFTLCYCGTINKWANPAPFLKALKQALAIEPPLTQKLTVQFIGLDTLGSLAADVDRLGLSGVVQIMGHLPHDRAVAEMSRADALLLLAQARETDTFIPGKTFEYIGSG
ncbi:MAG: hypothetical protein EHM72_07830 [Calditrichaeota bacterium]|nr:MAG: hypothetical protein EHM72_07830 [Calditrichota bacterium]